jgi:hypothetical protein
VSHLAERKEKNCLNCGAEVQGRYCHICGQENIEPKESFWHLVTHFVYDVTHFDGKFFSTLKYLLFRPGFLSHEYLRGRRASYLHPIRMYVFTSAFFFLVFFSMNKEDEVVHVNETNMTAAAITKKLERKRERLQASYNDSLPEIAKKPILLSISRVDSDLTLIRRDTTAKNKLKTEQNNFSLFTSENDPKYHSISEYDSLQEKMPPAKKDNFIRRRFARQNLHLREKYNNDGNLIWKAIFNKFKHLFPQMFFVSLPLFALLLQLLYVRKKSFYYVNHVVYSIHLYCGTFIIILISMFLTYLADLAHLDIDDWIGLLFTLAGFFYWYKSMRNFYEQRRAKTILKYLLLLILAIFVWALIFVVFFIFSAMAI